MFQTSATLGRASTDGERAVQVPAEGSHRREAVT
jgi:hypothetical protein